MKINEIVQVKEKLIRKFVSAIPADAYAKLGTKVQSGGGRGKYTQYRDGTMRGGGDDSKIRGQKSYDQSRIGKSGVGKFAKDVKDVFFTKDIGKSKSADFGSGLDLGDKIGNLFSEPVKTATSRGA